VDELSREGTVQTVAVNGKRVSVDVLKEIRRDPLELLVKAENRILRVVIGDRGENGVFPVKLNGKLLRASFELFEGASSVQRQEQAKGPIIITAPMSGRIVSLKVGVGKDAEEGESLVILEAMKMENEIACPRKGIVKDVYVQTGALVKAGDKLVLLE
jgi:biotin carboxyl carrier protein